MSSHPSSPDFILQTDWKEKLQRMGSYPWISVSEISDTEDEHVALFCALIPNDYVEKTLADPSWDISMGSGMPGCITRYDGDAQVTTYHRFGDNKGIEPFVFLRTFHGIRASHIELSEEFRHFHNLYHDQKKNEYIKILDDGNEEVIARLSQKKAELRLREVRQFLAIKNMHLAVFFSIGRDSRLNIADIKSDGVNSFNKELLCYRFYLGAAFSLNKEYRSSSRLLGKKLIPPLPIENCGMWPYDEKDNKDRRYEEFIIGTDKNGSAIRYTCDPERLADNFREIPGAPHYLTPVFFRRSVLQKYYANPTKFIVEDGHLKCGGLWGIQIDNNHPDFIVAFLGDLGRDLSNSEQRYWSSFNIPPEGSMSEVNYRRSFLAEFTDPSASDLKFKSMFSDFNEKWKKTFGWRLFRPLTKDDEHYFTSLRVPLSNEQSEFDNQILSLTKVLIDSLNEEKIAKELGGKQTNEKGIALFRRYLEQKGFDNAEKHVRFLRKIQDIRSSGTAHRKGSKYQNKIKQYGIDSDNFISAFNSLFREATEFLKALERRLFDPPYF